MEQEVKGMNQTLLSIDEIMRLIGYETSEQERSDERRQRLQQKAERDGVTADAYVTAHGDRWWPDWRSRSRAWLAK